MKKWIWLSLVVLMVFSPFAFGEEIYKPQNHLTGIIGGQSNEAWRLGIFGKIVLPEISTPSDDPPSNYGWIYVKDSSGASALYFENDGGEVFNISAASAPSWSDITAPTDAKTIAFSTNAATMTSAKTDGDMFTFSGIGNFGDYAVVHIKSATGSPTNGTILQVTSHDTDVDGLLVTANSINVLKVNGAGTMTIAGDTTITSNILGATPLLLEGETADGTNIVTVTVTDPTAARTLTIPDASGTINLIASASHNYGGAHADWTLSVNEERASYITATNANDASNIILSAAIPGKIYFIFNNSGQILTFKVNGQTGGTIANNKRALYVCDSVDLYEIWEQS